MQTENAEMYLVTMALLEEAGTPQPIPLPQLADALEVQVVSVNQMVRKLEEEGLVSYQPYKGVSFSEDGAREAYALLQHRRLWESFFIKHLGYSPEEADTLACRMEHITEPEMSQRLANFLEGQQTTLPDSPVHEFEIENKPSNRSPLTLLQVGKQAEVVEFHTSQTITGYLQSQGLHAGSKIRVQAISDAQVWLVAAGENYLSLDRELAEQIMITTQREAQPNEA